MIERKLHVYNILISLKKHDNLNDKVRLIVQSVVINPTRNRLCQYITIDKR
jgi:hypothetical protein